MNNSNNTDGFLNLDLDDPDQLRMIMPALLILLGELTEAAGDKLIFGPFGLNVPKYSLLTALSGPHNRMSMTAVKESMFLLRSSSNLTQLVDSLEERGLVRRIPSPEDRRVALIEITDAGRALLQEVNVRYAAVMREYTDYADLAELQRQVQWLFKQIHAMAHTLGIEKLMERPRGTNPAEGTSGTV